jgi:hypothetical protein
MPNETTAGKTNLFHCMIPSTKPADRQDPLPVLQQEMKLLLIEQKRLRAELDQKRAVEDELRKAKEFIVACVERVEQLDVIEAEARKAMEFWQREAQRMAQERPRWSRWRWRFSRLKSRCLVALGWCPSQEGVACSKSEVEPG